MLMVVKMMNRSEAARGLRGEVESALGAVRSCACALQETLEVE